MTTHYPTTSPGLRLLALCLLAAGRPGPASARLQFYDLEGAVRRDQSPRGLQTSGGPLPDLVAPTSTCFAIGGLQFGCKLHQRVGASDTMYTDLNATVLCDLGVYQFDFRRAENCGCSVLVTSSNVSRPAKTCACYVCPLGFGNSAISIDCETQATAAPSALTSSPAPSPAPTAAVSNVTGGGGNLGTIPPNATLSPFLTQAPTPGASTVSPFLTQAPTPAARLLQDSNSSGSGSPTPAPAAGAPTVPVDAYIFATCVSIDCAGNCNGTCSIGCDTSGDQCPFCLAATAPPTGAGNDTIHQLSGAPAPAVGAAGAALAAAAALLLL